MRPIVACVRLCPKLHITSIARRSDLEARASYLRTGKRHPNRTEGTMSKSEDLDLQKDEAEQVVGGAGKKHVTPKAPKSQKVVSWAIESTDTPGTPSPLTPEPLESYMGGE